MTNSAENVDNGRCVNRGTHADCSKAKKNKKQTKTVYLRLVKDCVFGTMLGYIISIVLFLKGLQSFSTLNEGWGKKDE